MLSYNLVSSPFRPHTINGRLAQPKRAVPREEAGNPTSGAAIQKIFIGGIKDKPITKVHRDGDTLASLLEKGGSVSVDFKIGRDRGSNAAFTERGILWDVVFLRRISTNISASLEPLRTV